jgi:VIT1/CCC1 family predicted Fe2+/Mn2+ transporter
MGENEGRNDLRMPNEDEVFAEVTNMLGANRVTVRCADGTERTARIPGQCFGRAHTISTLNMSHPTTNSDTDTDERSQAANTRLFGGILVLVGAAVATVGIFFWPALVVAALIWAVALLAVVLSFVSDDE